MQGLQDDHPVPPAATTNATIEDTSKPAKATLQDKPETDGPAAAPVPEQEREQEAKDRGSSMDVDESVSGKVASESDDEMDVDNGEASQGDLTAGGGQETKPATSANKSNISEYFAVWSATAVLKPSKLRQLSRESRRQRRRSRSKLSILGILLRKHARNWQKKVSLTRDLASYLTNLL